MRISVSNRILTGAALLVVTSTVLADGAIKQTVNVIGQALGPGIVACDSVARPLVAMDAATLIRTENGITASFSMPTPESAAYCYPPPNPFQTVAPVPGVPEVFTGWFFFFNHPENCAVPNACLPPPPGHPGPNDFTEAGGGVYNFAGHAISGRGSLNLVGHIRVGEAPFGGAAALENPMGAEVHLTVAPHGVLVPELLPEQISTPAGSPPYWWVALFDTP